MAQVVLNRPLLPYDTNRYYKHLLSYLADKNVYDVGRTAIANTYPKLGPSMNSVTAQNNGGGVLSIGTHYYVVVGILASGETQESREVSVDIQAPNNSANIVWSYMPGVLGYKIFRTEIQGDYRNSYVAQVSNMINTYTDMGSPTQKISPLATVTTFTGEITPAGTYNVELVIVNSLGLNSTIQQKISNPDGTYEFTLSIPRGENKYFVKVGNDKSFPIYVNAYNLHVFMEMMATELLNYWQENIEQIKSNLHIDPTTELFSSNLRYPTIQALQERWGDLTSVIKPSLFTYAQYVAILKAVLDSYKKATSFAAIEEVLQAYFPTWDRKNYIPYDIYGYGFKLGRTLKFDVVRDPIAKNWVQNTGAGGFDGRVRHASVVFGGLMYILGGTKVGGVLSDVWTSNDGATWNNVTMAAPWGPRTDMVALVYDGAIWIIGGNDGFSYLNDVWKSTDGVNWTQVTAAANFSARGEFAGTVFKGQMWISGGTGSLGDVSDVWYSNDGINWMEATSTAWTARHEHAMVAYHNKLYTVMGLMTAVADANVYQSDDGVNWSICSTFPSGRYAMSVIVHDNTLYLTGGIDVVTTNDVYKSTDGIVWDLVTQVSALPVKAYHTSLSYNDSLYVIAGETIVPGSDVYSTRVGDAGMNYSWTTGNICYKNERRYVKAGSASAVNDGVFVYVYIDGTVDADGYWVLKTIEQPTGNPLRKCPSLPDDVIVLAILIVTSNQILHISCQGRLTTTGQFWMGIGSGPFVVGPTYTADRGRIRSRGFKYSRFVIYLDGLAFFDVDRQVKIDTITAVLREVKPAKMTILLGIPPASTFVEI